MWRQSLDSGQSDRTCAAGLLKGDGSWMDTPQRWWNFALAAEVPHALYVPDAHAPGYFYPLVCYLHDDRQSEQNLWNWFPRISDQNFIGVGVRAPFPVEHAIPGQYRWRLERPGACSGALLETVEQAQRDWNVHPGRVYLMGEGSGAVAALQHLVRQQSGAFDDRPRTAGVICRSLPEDWPAQLPAIPSRIEGQALFLDRPDSLEQVDTLDTLAGLGLEVSLAEELQRPPASAINHWLMSQISTAIH